MGSEESPESGAKATLIVGLGNPGQAYLGTRHNVGFTCVSLLAQQHGLAFDQRAAKARVARGIIAGRRVVLAKPYTYMNRSGSAVVGLLREFGLSPRDLVVVLDDADLPLGSLRLRQRGSSGGHKGLQSIIESLATQDFARLRIGIGRPGEESQSEMVNHVLSRFLPEERLLAREALERAVAALEALLREGVAAAKGWSQRFVLKGGEPWRK